MSVGTATAQSIASRSLGGFLADLAELGKVKIVLMEFITILAGFLLAAPQGWSATNLLATLFGTALVAISASAFNQVLERKLDALMQRTKNRPLPARRMSVAAASIFAAATGLIGIGVLAIGSPLLATITAAVCWIIYVVIYTPLKTRTTWNTAVGAVSGALPILIGWFAGGGAFDLTALGLFGVLVFWQYPHFMAIAWRCRDDYLLADYVMSTTVDTTGMRAGRLAVGGALLLLVSSALPAVISATPVGGWLYCIVAILVWLPYAAASRAFARERNDATSRRLLRMSLLYLPAWLLSLPLLAL